MNILNRRRWLTYLATLPLTGLALIAPASDQEAGSLQSTGNNACNPLLSHRLRPLMGPEEQPLCDKHAGKVLLMVNTASKCGFTPQFDALETLHGRYADRGFEVLGFPSDDFRQELASEEEVAEFCELNYGVTFPMYQMIHVRQGNAHPLYRDLAAATGTYPAWNFNKYLVDREGRAVEHFGSSALPLGPQMIRAIEALL
jgi:glutathione peroxidase